ncbi:MAG: hypothetical protein CVU84_07990 [Firmicutes bacterium HGW-Firmicutes-1]|jgi:hypothetical protein|nr:MAG: hypothetical protein CVU84_07990 [Firmicutes bacterium HGW-Firmicutes-1]
MKGKYITKKGICFMVVIMLIVTFVACDSLIERDSSGSTKKTSSSKEKNEDKEENDNEEEDNKDREEKDEDNLSEDDLLDAEEYEITKATFSEGDIRIHYPHVEGLSNKDKQEKINELIKKDVLNILDEYSGESPLNLQLDYQITLQMPDFISIKYLGIASSEGAAYPNNLIHTTNVNITKEKIQTLSDVYSIDDNFIEHLKSGTYMPYTTDFSLEDVIVQDELNKYSNEELISQLSNKNAKYYYTEVALVISLNVAHVLGDHIEIEITTL